MILILAASKAGVLATIIGQMLDGGTSVIGGSGEQERDFIYAEDFAPANRLTGENRPDDSVA